MGYIETKDGEHDPTEDGFMHLIMINTSANLVFEGEQRSFSEIFLVLMNVRWSFS